MWKSILLIFPIFFHIEFFLETPNDFKFPQT